MKKEVQAVQEKEDQERKKFEGFCFISNFSMMARKGMKILKCQIVVVQVSFFLKFEQKIKTS